MIFYSFKLKVKYLTLFLIFLLFVLRFLNLFFRIYEYKECTRELEYLGNTLANDDLQIGKIYKSTHFNGATFKIDVNGHNKMVRKNYCRRIS